VLDHVVIAEANLPPLAPGLCAGGGAPLVPVMDPVQIHLGVENVHRTLGTMVSYEVRRRASSLLAGGLRAQAAYSVPLAPLLPARSHRACWPVR